MHEEHRLTELESGVRIVTEHMDSVRSVALGFWIGTGSCAETDEQAGLSHLLEHLLFRGSSRYGSFEIDQIFDAMGAEINAGTGKETTSVYARVLDVHLPEAFDVMHEMVWKPRIAAPIPRGISTSQRSCSTPCRSRAASSSCARCNAPSRST